MSLRSWAQATYLSLFSTFVSHSLSRKARVRYGSPEDHTIKIIARFQRSGGITNGALHNLSALGAAGYSTEAIDVSSAIRNPFRHVTCSPGGVWVFHCDAKQFPLFAWPLRRRFECRKLVGYFAWELATPPLDWPNEHIVWDEIWTPSRFAADSLAKHYRCPVHVVPHVVLKTGKPRVWNKTQEPLTFLTMADARSSFLRKNPRAVVRAFKSAFPSERDVRLVVKLQTSLISREFDAIVGEIADDPRIQLICATLDREKIEALFQNAHVYVSLHRAEGFGLPLLEARAFGLATIATAYSGNLDFMSTKDSVLIPYDLVEMTDGDGVYGQVTWANPDDLAAAGAMRRFYEDAEFLFHISSMGWEASQPGRQISSFAQAVKNADLG
jgi:glycosyltransferase involved in cell wall biosynthesis